MKKAKGTVAHFSKKLKSDNPRPRQESKEPFSGSERGSPQLKNPSEIVYLIKLIGHLISNYYNICAIFYRFKSLFEYKASLQKDLVEFEEKDYSIAI